MATRKQKRPSVSFFQKTETRSSLLDHRSRNVRRRGLLEKLEHRQMLAGPQLIGIQPNEGSLITDGSERDASLRLLTFRFDEQQQIASSTLDAIRITRAGTDGQLGTVDDQLVPLGSVTVDDLEQNEVLVRFADTLPDDRYRIEVFGFNDADAGITGLKNLNSDGSSGEFLIPSDPTLRKEQIDFDLNLGPLVESVVPQPVVRLADGTLEQRRNQIVVYFNHDPLFVEDDETGNPTERSAENPRFYQLLYTRDTVRTTDDELYFPARVVYDPATSTATLFFEDALGNPVDINDLTVGTHGPDSIDGGTFRLRVGTAVDTRSDLIVVPNRTVLPPGSSGDTFSTAYDVGLLGSSGAPLSSVIVSESIDPTPFAIELPGGNDDPGHRELPETIGGGFEQHIDHRFGPDTVDGVTTLSYNFERAYHSVGSTELINQINEDQRDLTRHALSLWGNYIGVQFLETPDAGLTFASGDVNSLSGPDVISQPGLSFTARVDPAFVNSTLVLDSERTWKLNYGEDYFRMTMTGIGILLGLEYTDELTDTTLLKLSPSFLNDSINQTFVDGFRPFEPVFPSSNDILHAQHIFRPDSNEIDMYRFVIDLDDADRTGILTAETFAERLPDASLLDSTLTLYQETKAKAVTDFGVGTNLSVTLTARAEGVLGNRTRLDFIRTDRVGGDLAVRLTPTDVNRFQVDIPRQNRDSGTPIVTVGSIVDAINADPFASSLVSAEITVGNPSIDVGGSEFTFTPIILADGGMEQLARNDDYYSEDSQIKATLSQGIYYIGVAASGNDHYDPNIPNSGYGGRTQGNYDLQLKFESQVDEVGVLRDLDSNRSGVPGTPLDGDGDGVPGGVHHFWFQTRPLNRQISINVDGSVIHPRQTLRLTGANGVVRTFEFVPFGTAARPGNIAVSYRDGALGGLIDSAETIAQKLLTAINSRSSETGAQVTNTGRILTLTGERSIDLSADSVGAVIHGRTIFVDKLAGVAADGSLQNPFNNISNSDVPNAFDAAEAYDIVRIVGNGGHDQRIETQEDNFSYQIGTDETFGVPLEDGRTMEVPRNVTVIVDAGAAFKMRASRIGVGSSNLLVDRSGGVLQVLGTPRLIDAGGNLLSDNGDVIFTSMRDRSVDLETVGIKPEPSPGNWGGIVFRQDIDNAEGRNNLESEGIFLQYVNHADIRYGGSGNLLVDSIQRVINPIQIIDVRPTITFNTITSSADAAISAAPDSFQETSFQSPRYQQAGPFTSDYDRVGPTINHNQLIDNSINGLFVRVETIPNVTPRALTVSGRMDDVDIVHYVAENIVIAGTPGGPTIDGTRPRLDLVTGTVSNGGSLAAGTYDYRMTMVDANGYETLASDPSGAIQVPADGGTILLAGLPPSQGDFLFRRLYRLDPASGDYLLVDDLNASDSRFVDNGTTTSGRLDLSRTGIRGRLDASLVIDPGMVVKLSGARIELESGTQLLAEGLAGQPIVLSSVLDDRFGAGGTFDTNNDNHTAGGEADPTRGDWAGIYAGPTSHVSLDHTVVAYGGGISGIEGTSRAFNPLELHQASARVTHSVFEHNDDGQKGAGPSGRFGRLSVTPSTIFVRGSQPTIVGNTFIDNMGSAIDIDVNSLTADYHADKGRQTRQLSRIEGLDDNRGPLVRHNLMDNNSINGMEVRGGEVINESVWDDTDVVHVLFDAVEVVNFHSSGGLRLQSRTDESLVVKLSGEGSPFSPTSGTGLTATGSPTDILDRIGGSLQILGQPGAPVILTSLADDTIGAGLKPDGSAQTDTNNDRHGTRPVPNDWRGVLLDQYSQDNNIFTTLELESPTALAPGRNAVTDRAQVLGHLAGHPSESDEVSRLGFDVEGFLTANNDIDTYSFTGTAGSEIWIDIDQTSFTLDSVIELLDADGNILARSDNSFAEVADPSLISIQSSQVEGRVRSLQRGATPFARFGAGGLYEDFGSTNPRDAGMRISLPGVTGVSSVYFFRVRSASVAPNDTDGGLTSGGYRFQVRLTEAQEFSQSSVKFADIRYANTGVHIRGLPGKSPFLGEAQENEEAASFFANNDSLYSNPNIPGQRAQYLGNLLVSDKPVVSVGGSLSSGSDIDFFQFDVNYQGIRTNAGAIQQIPTIFDIDYADGLSRPDTNISVFYDPDGETGEALPRLVLFGSQSNIAEDQSSPLAAEVAEILERGSILPGDAFIGPATLPEGSYFVAITNSNQVPAQLVGSTPARREPVNSIRRIVDDHIDQIGGATAEPPVVPTFIDQANLPAGWEITNLRSGDSGHGLINAYDQTRQGFTSSSANQLDREPNDTLVQAQNLDAIGNWSIQYNPDIGDATTNTSTTIPHTTVFGSAIDAVDLYQIQVPADGTRVIFDIDDAANFTFQDLNSKLWLLDGTGAVIETDTLTTTAAGQGGSVSALDAYIERTLNAGTYFIGVSSSTAIYIPETQTFTDTSELFNSPYTLHVSQENHAADSLPVGNQSLRFDPAFGTGTIRTERFDLSGYSAQDQPYLYFNYFLDNIGNETVTVRAVDPSGAVFELASSAGFTPALTTDGIWNQARVSLASFAGQSDLQIEIEYDNTGGITRDGLFLDDFIIGFAERGEMVVGAALNEVGFAFDGPAGSDTDGEYQLEIRPGTSYVESTPFGINPLSLTETFDTNDRHGQHITVVAYAGSELLDGDTFEISDGGRSVIFEFDDLDSGAAGVTIGNIRIPFRPTDPANVIATAMRDAINNPAVQAVLAVEAASADGLDLGPMTDSRINLNGSVQGEMFDVIDVTGVTLPVRVIDPLSGHLRLPAIAHNGLGDTNYPRFQSQVIIDSNRISDVRAIGIWSEPGDREIDPEDARPNNTINEFFDGFSGATNPFSQRPPLHSTHPGAVRNLPTLNNDVVGGMAPGVVIVNNVIDQAGYAGIEVKGQSRPLMITGIGPEGLATLENNFGDGIVDGSTFTIDTSGTRVIFEFEDLSGEPILGSGVVGGNGWADGHVPVYYRRDWVETYNPSAPLPFRNFAYTSAEVMHSIHDSILGSILVTNGLVQLVQPYVGPSYFDARPELEARSTHNLDVPQTALFLEGASNIYFSSGSPFSVDEAPVHEAPQPFARIVNNTIYGADGTESLFAESGRRENNDTLPNAVDTKQGISQTGSYLSLASIGDQLNPLPSDQDVDFYRIELGAGDRALLDVDTNSTTEVSFFEVDFPQGLVSFADRVVRYDPLAGGGPAATINTDLSAIVGPPVDGEGENLLSLSEGGSVILEFTDNVLIPSLGLNPDLQIFESGDPGESVLVEISEDGFNYVSVGSTAGTNGAINIDAFPAVNPEGRYRFVRLTDDPLDFRAAADGSFGADINAVGALSTIALPLDTVMQLYNDRGEIVASNDNALAPDYLETADTTPFDFLRDSVSSNARDPFIDYTAIEPGTYFIGISSKGNEGYDPFSLGNRTTATGGQGNYALSVDVLAPRSFVFSFTGGGAVGNLIGTTFTVTQIPDLAGAASNEITFEFTEALSGRTTPAGNINIPIRRQPAFRVPDVMRAISDAINGFVDDPTIPNHEFGNGPDGLSGPIQRASAMALGGQDGDGPGLFTFPTVGTRTHVICRCGVDLQNGFGHNRTSEVNSSGVPGSTTFGDGTTELYAFLEGVAKVRLSDEASSAGLGLDPQPGTNHDQLLPETGIMVREGASPSILNNLILNTHEGIVDEETRSSGFGIVGLDAHRKPQQVIVSGSIFQHNDGTNPLFRNRIPTGSISADGITTNPYLGTSNVNGGTDDFNQTLTNNQALLENAAGNRFLPSVDSPAVDSAINSLSERSVFASLKQAIGVPVSNVLAPNRDLTGQLRVDDPAVAPPGGRGGFVFKDRGALDRADFIGPVADTDIPQDNDAEGRDLDPAISVIQLADGTFSEFRILLRDTGDEANPFTGTGINDSTVVGPSKENFRQAGAILTLFENDRLLIEGIDYTFSYDDTKNLIILTPLAGIWENDRSYRIVLNNRDRFVVFAPQGSKTNDGTQLFVTGTSEGQLAFEFDSGYSLQLPETLTLTVPRSGTGLGGIANGQRFSIKVGDGLPVTFEFDLATENLTLPGSIRIPFSIGDSPESIAGSVATAVAGSGLDVTTALQGTHVVLGAEAGTELLTINSGLQQAPYTLAFRVPSTDAGFDGIANGDTFTINDGLSTAIFEFDTDGSVLTNHIPIAIVFGLTPAEMLRRINTAIVESELNISPTLTDDRLFLNLPIDGSASKNSEVLELLGSSRTVIDGTTLTFTPVGGGTPTTFELNRTDQIPPSSVANGNIPIDFTRDLTANQLAEQIAGALAGAPIAGLDPSKVKSVGSGILSIGGEPGLGLTVSGSPGLDLVGEPGVSASSGLHIRGPILMRTPEATAIDNGDRFTITHNGITEIFEFHFPGSIPDDTETIRIPFSTIDNLEQLTESVSEAINESRLGITTTLLNPVSGLIRIDALTSVEQVNVGNSNLSVFHDTVSDGEQILISQQGTILTFEFDDVTLGGSNVTPGAIQVPFQSTGTILDLAATLTVTINNHRGSLNLNAVAEGDGVVRLNDAPGTVINVDNASSVSLSGVPGGAIPVPFDKSFTATEMKRSLLDSMNRVSPLNLSAFGDFSVEDRGGNSIFVDNVVAISSNIDNYFMRGIADQAGNLLRANRDDNSTQFTILMPTVGLDFGDAPDPHTNVPGRYPTRFDVDGARHVVDSGLFLGQRIDADIDGQPTINANGDDTSIDVIEELTNGTTFAPTLADGSLDIEISVTPVDGDTITLSTGVSQATFEFDDDGRFNEDHFAVAIQSGETAAQAFQRTLLESPLRPAAIEVNNRIVKFIVDDEDGVSFLASQNLAGVFNSHFSTPIDVTVTGEGVVEAWVDFNGDGDWTDPGEQIIDANTPGALFDGTTSVATHRFTISLPDTTPTLSGPMDTYARFRVSRKGGLTPIGLSLSGEVEDYQVRILPGAPPTVDDTNSTKVYTILEGSSVLAFDADGGLSPTNADNGLLFDISDPDGDAVEIAAEDVGTRRLTDSNGHGGVLELAADGTFRFTPEPGTPDIDFFGQLTFEVRVTDIRPAGLEDQQLISPNVMTVTINVMPVNDPPIPATATAPVVQISTSEDTATIIPATRLINGQFLPGPANESDQGLFVSQVGFQPNPAEPFESSVTKLGGSLEILDDGSVRYTPPADYNGTDLDEFIYSVSDIPTTPSELAQISSIFGTVTIRVDGINDPPIVNDDLYQPIEDQDFVIPLRESTIDGILVVGIFDNDLPGPADELDQTLSLVTTNDGLSLFPLTTVRGGTVRFDSTNNQLTYTPAPNFSGADQFTYQVIDGPLGNTASGTVVLDVSGNNDSPIFIGIDGISGNNKIDRTESKDSATEIDFDLNSWFTDPEGDQLIFSVTSSNSDVGQVQVVNGQLTLTLPPFEFGTADLRVRATNAPSAPGQPNGPFTEIVIPLTVTNTPDAPIVIGSLDPLLGAEDNQIPPGSNLSDLDNIDLSTIFSDPDQTQLTYRVISPTSFESSSLVESVVFPPGTDRMQVNLHPNASGQIEITIGASDGTFEVTDTFTLTVNAVADPPVGTVDQYDVPVGGRLSIINPDSGLRANDFDPDGNEFRVDPTQIGQPTKGTLLVDGTLSVNPDGTFVYVNTSGSVGETDTFTYRLSDSTGLSDPITVTLNLVRSEYQNPITGMNTDVTADGFVTPLDALRVINLINRNRTTSVPVSQIPGPPPDYYDVNGDGQVQPMDALLVINVLNSRSRINSSGEGEFFTGGTQATTSVTYAAVDPVNLPQSNRTVTTTELPIPPNAGAALDKAEGKSVWGRGPIEVVDNRVDNAVNALVGPAVDNRNRLDSKDTADNALLALLSETNES